MMQGIKSCAGGDLLFLICYFLFEILGVGGEDLQYLLFSISDLGFAKIQRYGASGVTC
jgi:hypothetical protein